MEFYQVNIFVLYDQIFKYIKLFKIQGTGCQNLNARFTSSPKDGLVEFV